MNSKNKIKVETSMDDFFWRLDDTDNIIFSNDYLGIDVVPKSLSPIGENKVWNKLYTWDRTYLETANEIDGIQIKESISIGIDMEQKRLKYITPILIEAINEVCPEYFNLTEIEQDLFVLDPENDKFEKKIYNIVETHYKNKYFGDSEITSYNDDKYDLLSEKDKENFRKNEKMVTLDTNNTMLAYCGIGDKCFMLNEFSSTDILNENKTLYEYNMWFHDLQESDKHKNDKTELYSRLSFWGRTYADDGFQYVSGDSLSQYLFYKTEEIVDKWFDKYIKYDFVEGPLHGKQHFGDDGKVEGTLWDMVVDANGLEKEYKHMRKFSSNLLIDVIEDLKSVKLDGVFIIKDTPNCGDNDDNHRTYVFGSMDVLHRIHFMSFYDDCIREENKNHNELNDLISKFEIVVTQKLNREFSRISPFNYCKTNFVSLISG